MATTLVPPPAAPAKPGGGAVRFVDVRANLIPDEIISARQVEILRKQVLIALVAIVVLLLGWFALSWWQTRSADSSLSSARHKGIALESQQNEFRPLVESQAEIDSVRTQLQQLMVADLSWKDMLSTLRSHAPAGVTLVTITGSVTAGLPGSSPGTTVATVTGTGQPDVGQLTLGGTAPDKKTVATYADNLAKVPGLSSPLISNVVAGGHPIAFTINVDITGDALGGRYTAASSLAGTTGDH